MKILDVTRVTPSSNTPESAPTAEFRLPLTFSDIFWLKIPPVERLFFYPLNDLTPAYFNSVVLPKLKHSLSLTLLHYLPLAGNLKWPSNEPKPIILYTPDDGASLTVAESDADFNLLSSNGVYDAVQLHHLKPELVTSDVSASAMALQVSLFPNKGFCIGITSHHGVLDGKSTTMFIQSWAYICNTAGFENSALLPPELTPFYDRSVFKGPDGLDMLYLKQWLEFSGSDDSDKKSLKIAPSDGPAPDLVRATFEITREDINRLRGRVLSKLPDTGKDLHLSTFVLTYAYVTTCFVKAKGVADRNVGFGFVIDCRPRLNPPVPQNYFGNCISAKLAIAKASHLSDEDGFILAVQKLSGLMKDLMEKGVFDGIETLLSTCIDIMKELAHPNSNIQLVSLAGSPRFGVYGSDFGWGKPVKVVVVSIDKNEAISMAESRDGNGGVEVGLALKKDVMDKFSSLFLNDV